ncbi:MAG TPA: alpha/beta family hydrolase [Myxococcota bacterium]|nr:alpha/beta family hydrolase [Myxococcota bacterium]
MTEVSAVLGVPQWWPTGQRVGVVLAHGAGRDLTDPVLEFLQRALTERRCLTLRFNFPFGEGAKKRPDSPEVLQRTFRAAIAMLARDPNAAPARLFLGGKGIGGATAASLAGARVRVDGTFFMGFPLHPSGRPELVQPEELFRVISPMLFLQGERDRSCDLDALRAILTRVGAPTALQVIAEADQHFSVLKKSPRSDEEVRAELLACIHAWIQKVADT